MQQIRVETCSPHTANDVFDVHCFYLLIFGKFRLLIFLLIYLNQLYMFRATKTRPPSRAFFDCIYSFWYNAPILLPTGDKVEMEILLSLVTGRQQLNQKLYI